MIAGVENSKAKANMIDPNSGLLCKLRTFDATKRDTGAEDRQDIGSLSIVPVIYARITKPKTEKQLPGENAPARFRFLT